MGISYIGIIEIHTYPTRKDQTMTKIKTSKTTRKAAPHTAIMGAVTKSLSDGRMRAFMDTPNEETRDAIVDQVRKNLTALMKGKSVKSAPKTAKTEKTEKVSKSKRLAKKVRAADEMSKTEKTINRIALKSHAAVLRIKSRTDDADKIKSSVSRLLKKQGLDVVSVRGTGTAKIERSGQIFAVKFTKTAPTVSFIGNA